MLGSRLKVFRKDGASAVQVWSARDWFATSRHASLAAKGFSQRRGEVAGVKVGLTIF